MATSDDRLTQGTIGTSANGSPLGLILNQLIIISIILKEIAGITDDDFTLLGQAAPILNPKIAANPNFSEPL